MSRPAVVAGRFYEADAEALRRQVADHLERGAAREPALGVVVPHAGFMFSGDVAGAVYARIEVPGRVILIGPNHTGAGKPIALAAPGSWTTPLGEVAVDDELTQAILDELPEARADARAHAYEHSLETQLPFLQSCRDNFSIVPICLMRLSLEECRRLGRAIVAALRRLDCTALIVASSDMTHYESHASACEKDHRAIDCILQLDVDGLYETVRRQRISMCGMHPVAVMLECVLEQGGREARLVRYMTSGEVNGDLEHVVGYAGMIVR